ncbi:MAG TPA: 6-pyruvoyl-tetrahydropterin synthase-related protein [Pyrinomonadaceae bacterium]|nr:6-pyruvoyl-tetrahydropterin synthase-related protein [Pyrinomonadaceae bacterium]
MSSILHHQSIPVLKDSDARLRGLRISGLTNELRFLVVIIGVGMLALLPMMFWGIPSGGDLPNHYRFVLPFYDAIHSGHLYPGWLAESNYGFGDARFRFYPPGLYYLLTLFKSAAGWYWASIATFTFLSVLGGLGMYFWARTSHSRNVAMWAGVLYVIAPYHLNQLYQASLLSEYAACSVLPFVFAFVERTCRRQKAIDVAGLAASYALLVLTHLPLTVIGSLSLALYAITLLSRKTLFPSMVKLGSGVVIGLVASSFFWMTMLAELPWIKGNSANQNLYYDYRANFLFSPSALTNRNTWYANLLAFALIGMLLPAVILIKKKTDSATKAVGVVAIASLLMATELSRPLWIVIPRLREVQFPWRWLAITSIFGSIVLAASLPKWKEIYLRKLRPLHLAPALGVALSIFFIASQIVWDSDYLARPAFDSLLGNIRGSASFKDWMPLSAGEDIKTFAASDQVTAGDRKVVVQDWQPEHRQFNINSGAATEARVRTFYYPLWKATAGEQSLAVRPAQDGAILITLPAEARTVSLDFQEPRRVGYARVASGAGWLLIIALCLWSVFHKRLDPQHTHASS